MIRFIILATLVVGSVETLAAQTPVADRHDAAQVQQTVREVLADPEYRHLFRDQPETTNHETLPEWLRKILEYLFRDDSDGISAGAPATWFNNLLFYGVIAVLVVFVIVILIHFIRTSSTESGDDFLASLSEEEAINPSTPPGDRPANEYERRALAAAQAGDYRAALRELVLGAMSWTERAGLIRYRRGLTNRDYVRANWRHAERRQSILQIVAAFERVFYGRRLADEPTFAACLAEFRKSFSLEATDAQLAG